MPKIISSSEAQSRFGEILRWTKNSQDEVIVKHYGEPAVVIMSYAEYEAVEKLRKREQKRKAFEALDRLRDEARRQNPGFSDEDTYRLAGFAEEVIAETLKSDETLTGSRK